MATSRRFSFNIIQPLVLCTKSNLLVIPPFFVIPTLPLVIPAKAGIHHAYRSIGWIPVFAGMTE